MAIHFKVQNWLGARVAACRENQPPDPARKLTSEVSEVTCGACQKTMWFSRARAR